MKKLSMLIVAVMLLTVLSGCSSIFSTGEASRTEESGKSTDIQISETFVHHDPEGMEYAKRYAYTSGKNVQELIDSFKEYYDLDIVEQFMIIYADAEDKPLAQFDYYAMKDEEQAKKCAEALSGSDVIVEGDVAYIPYDAAGLQMLIDMNVQYGSLKEKTVSAYALFMKDVNFFMDVE